MKIKHEHYYYLEKSIYSYCNDNKTTLYDLWQQYKTKGLTEMRFRWDLTYAAKLTPWICDNLYSYLNDNHIDTALRKITNVN